MHPKQNLKINIALDFIFSYGCTKYILDFKIWNVIFVFHLSFRMVISRSNESKLWVLDFYIRNGVL